jgi:hypothetical protein
MGVLSAIYSTASGRFALQMRVGDAVLFSFTSASRLERGLTVAWSKTMMSKLAKVTGLALLTASFAFSGSPVYAGTEDTTSIQILTFDAIGNPGEIIAVLDCDTGDGMGNCPVDITVAAEALATTVADAFDPAVLEAAAEPPADIAEPAIHSVDAIVAVVTGETDAVIEEPAQATEAVTEVRTMRDASLSQLNEEKVAEASTAVVVEITHSATVAIPGQSVVAEPVVTGSASEPSSNTPVSMLDEGKNSDEDF